MDAEQRRRRLELPEVISQELHSFEKVSRPSQVLPNFDSDHRYTLARHPRPRYNKAPAAAEAHRTSG